PSFLSTSWPSAPRTSRRERTSSSCATATTACAAFTRRSSSARRDSRRPARCGAGSKHGRSSSTRASLNTEWTLPSIFHSRDTKETRGRASEHAGLVGRRKAQGANHLQLARPLVGKVGKVRSVEDAVRAPAQHLRIGPARKVTCNRHRRVEIEVLELVEHGLEL